MTTLENQIRINAPISQIWEALANIENLEKYDPTVEGSKALTESISGIQAKRKVNMKDGKNWFEEKITEFEPNKALTFELTACSFPVHQLKHSYTFESDGDQTNVKQVMKYKVKFGILGRIMDALMIKKQSDDGIKQFFSGLKNYLEQQANKLN